MIDNEEILIRQTECLGMMHALKDDIRNMHHTLYSVKGRLSFTEARKYLGMKLSTLYKKTMNNEIQFYSPCNKRLYFKRQELEQWMLQNRHLTNEEMQAETALSGVTNLYAPKRTRRRTKKQSNPQ